MEKQALHQELERLLKFLKKVHPVYSKDIPEIEKSHPRKAISSFMEGTYDLYLALKHDSSIKSDVEFQTYIKQSAGLMTWLTMDINTFIYEIEETLGSVFYDNEWEGVCWRRSAVEALKKMYRNTVLEEHFHDLDTEDLDLYIKGKGEMEGGVEKIPDGIPPSHWWWWYPDPPPETSVF
jgi:hypothetical protein